MLLLADCGRIHCNEDPGLGESKIAQWTNMTVDMFSKDPSCGENLGDLIIDSPALRFGGQFEYKSACNWVNPDYKNPQIFKSIMDFSTPVRHRLVLLLTRASHLINFNRHSLSTWHQPTSRMGGHRTR